MRKVVHSIGFVFVYLIHLSIKISQVGIFADNLIVSRMFCVRSQSRKRSRVHLFVCVLAHNSKPRSKKHTAYTLKSRVFDAIFSYAHRNHFTMHTQIYVLKLKR